ncbi:DUF5723 family protein [Telluribacter sp. SYSU D00476]|uniref:DUF5723 family protein n=1 Tax=Telluribacter sp. SYSU D00476 TaxID=2811430 RepID=UPI001FF24EFF|nr:DUF5723 family protein [Telluribacter sp. SYSU D00476]
MAQHMPGAAMSNYAGTQALYHNPAFVADSRYSVFLNLAGAQLYMAGNHAKYNAPFSIASLLTNTVPAQYRNERGAIDLKRRHIEEKLNGRLKHLNGGGDLRLPSLMVTLPGGRFGIAATARARLGLNATQVTEPIARLARGGTRESNLMDEIHENQRGNLHFNGLGEVAFTFGGIVLDDETDFFKAGATVKRIVGLYNAHAIIDNTSFGVVPDPAYNNRKEIIQVPTITTRYGYTSEEAVKNFRPSPGWLVGGDSPGGGWGLDLGVVYEYRPDVNKYSYTEKGIRKRDGTKNKYLYRLAVSLTDIGRVNFKNPVYVKQQEANAVDKEFRFDNFQKLKGSDGFFAAVSSSLGVPPPPPATFRSVLPTALQASLDYNIKPNVYVNTLWVQNLRSPSAFGMKAESVLAVTPRYEHRWYELSVPVSLMNRYSSLGVGLAGRVGPVWFGTDHLTSLLNIGKPKVFNVYFGVSAGLFRRPPLSPTRCWPAEASWWKRLFQRKEYR